MAGSGGPWGGGPDQDDDRRGGNRPGNGSQPPKLDDMLKKGGDQLRLLVGGRGGNGGSGSGYPGGSGGFGRPRNTVGLIALAALGLWGFASFYTVKPEEAAVELMLGKRHAVLESGLHFVPWPIYSAEVFPVTPERTEDIGVGETGGDEGLMLTGDENIVDIDFQVVWNISDPEAFLFNLRDPELTIRAVSESAMREIIAQSPLAPILNRDRGAIATRLQLKIQEILDSYHSGLNVVRVNFLRADPPTEVIDAFKEVQSAEQERDRLQKEADAYSNKVVAGARGEAAARIEAAQAYKAQVVNEAEGEASRFGSVLAEYRKSPDVTRERLWLETMEEVLGSVNKVIVDPKAVGQQGVVPYLPLNDLGPKKDQSGGTN